jgi:hypothetical protein
MKRPVKIGLWALGSLAALVFLAYALILFNSFRNRQKAEALLQDIKSLEIGVSSTEDVLLAVKRYEGGKAPRNQYLQPNEVSYSFEIRSTFINYQSTFGQLIVRFLDHFRWLNLIRLLDSVGVHPWLLRASLSVNEDRLSGASYSIMTVVRNDNLYDPLGRF